MAIETKIQKQRSGNLAQLPILLAGELGYALDAKRLFIGNTAELQDGNGTKTDFTFGVDLDDISSSTYKITVDSFVKTDATDYTVDNFTVSFIRSLSPISSVTSQQVYDIGTTDTIVSIDVDGTLYVSPTDWTLSGTDVTFTSPSFTTDNSTITVVVKDPLTAGTGNVSLEYNSEIHLFEPDVGLDAPRFVAITSSSGAMPVAFDGTRYDNVDIRYSLRNAIGHIRKGVLSIAVNAANTPNTHTISDNYTTDATTSGSLLDHVFTGTMSSGLFTLHYATNDTANADFAWLTDNFKATL